MYYVAIEKVVIEVLMYYYIIIYYFFFIFKPLPKNRFVSFCINIESGLLLKLVLYNIVY